jgi:hypothetical protein
MTIFGSFVLLIFSFFPGAAPLDPANLISLTAGKLPDNFQCPAQISSQSAQIMKRAKGDQQKAATIANTGPILVLCPSRPQSRKA